MDKNSLVLVLYIGGGLLGKLLLLSKLSTVAMAIARVYLRAFVVNVALAL